MRLLDAIRGRAHKPDPLAVPLGEGAAGPVAWRVAEGSGHLLVSGLMGSGKSMAMLAILTHICRHPGAWQAYLIDPRGLEFRGFEKHPAVREVADLAAAAPVAAARMLGDVRAEMDRRHEMPAAEMATLPRLAVVVDEVAEVIDAYPALREPLEALVAHGPAAGVHMILAPQRPDMEAVAGMEHVERLSMLPRSLGSLRATYLDSAGERELQVYWTEATDLDQAGPG